MDTGVPKLPAADRGLALAVMQRWAQAHPDPEAPQWLSTVGELISPRRLAEGMAAGDEIGEFWFHCLAVARSGDGPVGFDEVVDAHLAQAISWEAERQRTLE